MQRKAWLILFAGFATLSATAAPGIPLFNVAPPLDIDVHRSTPKGDGPALPIADTPFIEHVRMPAEESAWPKLEVTAVRRETPALDAVVSTEVVEQGGRRWVGTADGLYGAPLEGGTFERHPTYGVDGPPSNVIAGLALDSHDTLWVATRAGLAARTSDGAWRIIRGREGLPWEELTCLATDARDRLWIGSTRGMILYAPYETGRQWYYRAGERYLPNDHVLDIAVARDGAQVYVRTAGGVSRIDEVARTLHGKAEYLEARFNDRHRRLGLPSPATHNDAYTMERWEHGPQPSDGLWASYHVAAMSMAYTLTQEQRYKTSAIESMEALYLLQNVTGIKGLVARSVVAVDEPAATKVTGQENWLKTKDGRYLWRDDVSSDQIDGHFFAFYTYYEHIARHDAAERERIQRQVRQVTDYIVDNGYQILDWDGTRTMWGWWDPDSLNNKPIHYLESGIYSLMMLSFLKTAHHITGDDKYDKLYRDLIEQHGYLSNLLLEKKLFPDELNHSDDQLSAVAYYPILQLEKDPFIRDALHRAVRRHAYIELPERNSLFALTYASIDSQDADIAGALQTLREMPQDRRNWGMLNSYRADVVLNPTSNRGGSSVLLELLPADERQFERWNQDPYEADVDGDGRTEGSGEHYLLPYWMARFHGLLAAPGGS